MSVTVTCLCTTLTIIGLELHVLVNMKFQKSQRGNCIPMKCGDCFLFSCKLCIETNNTGIQQNIFLANKNRSSNIDIYLTLFLSPNSSEGRAWANKILLARYIKPEKIDYDNVNMFK